jgi:hypothetical protein
MVGVGESGMRIVHDFRQSLEYSNTLSNEAAWVDFYRRLWPQAQYILRCDDAGPWQKWGIDRRVTLAGRDVMIDEKKRDGTWDDVLLEEWSVYYGPADPRNKIGWSLDDTKRCDFVAYAVPKRRLCYLLPFELLRLAYQTHRAEWHRATAWYPKIAQNATYQTINCAVPWDTLKRALVEQMYRQYGDELILPVPTVDMSGQLLFSY